MKMIQASIQRHPIQNHQNSKGKKVKNPKSQECSKYCEFWAMEDTFSFSSKPFIPSQSLTKIALLGHFGNISQAHWLTRWVVNYHFFSPFSFASRLHVLNTFGELDWVLHYYSVSRHFNNYSLNWLLFVAELSDEFGEDTKAHRHCWWVVIRIISLSICFDIFS